MRTSLSTVLVLTPTLLAPGPAFTLMLIRALTLTLPQFWPVRKL